MPVLLGIILGDKPSPHRRLPLPPFPAWFPSHNLMSSSLSNRKHFTSVLVGEFSAFGLGTVCLPGFQIQAGQTNI